MVKLILACLILLLISLSPLLPIAHANIETDDFAGLKTYKLYRYVADLGYSNDKIDYLKHPTLTLMRGGDCEDLAFLLWLVLQIVVIHDVSFVYGQVNERGHYWVESHGTLYDPASKFTQNAEYAYKHYGFEPKFKLTR